MRRVHRGSTIRVGDSSHVVLRAVFGLLFGAVGFLIGREAYVNVFSIHFSNQWTQVALLVLAPVAGAMIGVLVAPVAQSLFE